MKDRFKADHTAQPAQRPFHAPHALGSFPPAFKILRNRSSIHEKSYATKCRTAPPCVRYIDIESDNN